MDPGRAVLLTLALLTALNWAVHHYTHHVTYRLFPAVAAETGGPGFVAYHQAYQRRLPVAVYAPWSALLVASTLLVVVRPEGLGIGWPLTLLALNSSIAALSVAFAAPVHRRIDESGQLTPGSTAALLRWNAVRLAVTTLSLLVVGALSLTHLAG